MGVCGSCGMMVNGKPKLTCAAFLSDSLPGPIRVEPLRYFPIVRDLVVDITDFMRKLKKVKPWIIRKEEKPPAEGEYLQTPEQLDIYKQFSTCINCMLCYCGLPGLWIGAAVHRPRGHRAGPALQQRLARPGRPGTDGDLLGSTTASGSARSWASAPRPAPSRSIRPGRSSSTSWPARPTGSSPGFFPGGLDERARPIHPLSSQVVPARRVGVVVAGELVLYPICPAGDYQRLRGLLRLDVSLAAAQPWPGPDAYAHFMARLKRPGSSCFTPSRSSSSSFTP